MTDFVDINGNPINIGALTAKSRTKRPKASAMPTASHLGWRVVGHPPGACASAQAEIAEAWRKWNAHTGEQRSAALKRGERSPDMWDETLWRNRTKKRNINGRPYGIPQAADECAELARKAGWEDVQVIELKKGEELV